MLNPLLHSSVKSELFTHDQFAHSRLQIAEEMITKSVKNEERQRDGDNSIPYISLGDRSDQVIS